MTKIRGTKDTVLFDRYADPNGLNYVGEYQTRIRVARMRAIDHDLDSTNTGTFV